MFFEQASVSVYETLEIGSRVMEMSGIWSELGVRLCVIFLDDRLERRASVYGLKIWKIRNDYGTWRSSLRRETWRSSLRRETWKLLSLFP